jgi:hypothetical protein
LVEKSALVHPFASAIDTELPKAPSSVHLLLRDKASWVERQIGLNDDWLPSDGDRPRRGQYSSERPKIYDA